MPGEYSILGARGRLVDLLLKMGYGGSRADAGQAIGKGGDEGIDGVISEDRLGLDMVYLQAKRWEGSVGRPEFQKSGEVVLIDGRLILPEMHCADLKRPAS